MGRPLKEIDAEEVYKLAQLGCTQEEIGRFCGCSHTTIQNRFLQEYELGRASQVISVRRWQMKKGKSGCTAMLIHLGKNVLGQTDRIDTTSKGEQVGVKVVELPIKELHGEDQTESGTADPVSGLDG